MKWWLVIFLLVPLTAARAYRYTDFNFSGYHEAAYTDTIEQSELPYTITSAGRYRIIDSIHYSGTGAAISIEANNVRIDAVAGACVSFADGSKDNTYGIKILADNVDIVGPLSIRSFADAENEDANHCIYIPEAGGNEYIWFDTLLCFAGGEDAQCLLTYAWKMIAMTRCLVSNQGVWWYTNRCGYDGSAIRCYYMDATLSGNDSFNLYIEACSVITHASGGRIKGVVKIYDNAVAVGAENLKYTSPDNYCQNSSNAYGWNIRGCKSYYQGGEAFQTVITGNRHWATHDHFGSDGHFEVENSQGVAGLPILIYGNKSVCFRGYDNYFATSANDGGLYARGVAKIRADGDPGDIQYIYVHHDSCLVYSKHIANRSDSATDSSGFGSWATAFSVIADPADVGNVIESCYINVVSLIDSTDPDYYPEHQGASGFILQSDWAEENAKGWIIQDNEVHTNHCAWRVGTGDGRAERWDSVYNNSFTYTDSGFVREYINVRIRRYGSEENILTDNITTPDSVWSLNDMKYGVSEESSFWLKRTLELYVMDSTSEPVANCSVFVWNDYVDSLVRGDAILSGVTNNDGFFSERLSVYFLSAFYTDSTAFQPFRWKAKISTDSASDTMSFTTNTYLDTLFFGTVQEPPPSGPETVEISGVKATGITAQ